MGEPNTYLVEERVACAVAREAGQIMLEGARRGFDVELKGPHDVVTDVDRRVERYVARELASAFPEDQFLGEEYGAEDIEGADRRWVVDPIDGTLNFSKRIPFFCISIALQVEGESVLGVIYEPHRDELFSAIRGKGARLDGEEIATNEGVMLEDSVLATGFVPIQSSTDIDNLAHFEALARSSRNIRRLGSAALDLAYVACGRLDGFWEFHLNPWDTAAGYLLVEESGGVVTDLNGESYTAHEECVVASAGSLHSELLVALQNVGVTR